MRGVSFILEEEASQKILKGSFKDGLIEILCLIGTKYAPDGSICQLGIFDIMIALQSRMVDEWLREEYLADFCAELLDCAVVTWESCLFSDGVLRYYSAH